MRWTVEDQLRNGAVVAQPTWCAPVVAAACVRRTRSWDWKQDETGVRVQDDCAATQARGRIEAAAVKYGEALCPALVCCCAFGHGEGGLYTASRRDLLKTRMPSLRARSNMELGSVSSACLGAVRSQSTCCYNIFSQRFEPLLRLPPVVPVLGQAGKPSSCRRPSPCGALPMIHCPVHTASSNDSGIT